MVSLTAEKEQKVTELLSVFVFVFISASNVVLVSLALLMVKKRGIKGKDRPSPKKK